MMRSLRPGVFLVLLLLVGVSPALAGLPPEESVTPASHKLASNLGFLLTMLDSGMPVRPDSDLGRTLARIESSGSIEVSAHFAHELSPVERADLESLGVVFQQVGDVPARVGPYYGLAVPLDAVQALAAHPLTVWLEAAWLPAVQAPLDLSLRYLPNISYVDAPATWSTISPLGGLPLTGHGVTVANFDTGIDVRHPAFLSGTFGTGYSNWDTNGDGTFTPGVDQLGGATLRYWDAVGDPANNPGVFDVWQDWVYGDANSNSSYDWNEVVYMAYDANMNGVLDAGEFLISRGTMGAGIPSSKIAATLDSSGVPRFRGVDLEQTAVDLYGHGTSVAGIMGAGAAYWNANYVWNYARRYTGLAPDADLVVADRYNNPSSTYMSWAQNQGAQVMLYEYGGWIQTYLDGSSPHELMMDALSDQGILQVVPAGNLHCGGAFGCNPRHLQYSLPATTWFPHIFNVPTTSPNITQLWTTMLWLNPTNNMLVDVMDPSGFTTGPLPCVNPGSGWQYVTLGNHTIGCERAVDSPRGTAMYNLYIFESSGGNVATGNWGINVFNAGGAIEPTNFYIADDATTWAFGAGWLNVGPGIELHTATWPSTCDSCIGVASYATRANVVGTPGALSWFSGRGPRFFDNARIVDVAAPGHYDIVSPETRAAGSVGAYNPTFGGTSAAGPHVAALAALLYQYAGGSTDANEVGQALMRGAVADGFTGATPNDTWGHGKISGPGAVSYMMHDLGDAPASDNNASQPMQAYAGVQANFPTVFSAAAPGPLHWAAGSIASGPVDSCLGTTVSVEGEADSSYDEDLLPNIDPASDTPDQDNLAFTPRDDGLWLPLPLGHCLQMAVPYTLTVNGPSMPRYSNIWFDWNHDGDWGDTLTCPGGMPAPEWSVPDEMIVLGPGPITVPWLSLSFTSFIHVSEGEIFETWMRLSLAETTAPAPYDGRGPSAGYDLGETEDYYLWFEPSFEKSLDPPGDPLPGQQVVYRMDYNGQGNVIAVGTVISDVLPAGVDYVSSDPPGFYDPATRAISWTTDLWPNQPALVEVTVEVTGQPSDTVTNTAALIWGGQVWERSSASFHIAAPPVSPTAYFTATGPACLSDTVYFTNLSTGTPPLSYAWDLDGDGLVDSTETHPSWLYGTPGAYRVTLTATNLFGLDVYTDTVEVLQPLIGLSIEGPVILLVDDVGLYTAQSTPPDASDPLYEWDNGIVGVTTTYSWSEPGQYTIALTGSNDCGLVTATLAVEVVTECVPLTGVAIEGPTTLQVGEEGLYLASIEPPTATHPAYLWMDGSTAASTVLSWALPGTYTVAVTATNCQDVRVTDTLEVRVERVGCISLTGVSIAGPASLLVGEEGVYQASPQPPEATDPDYAWNGGLTGTSAVYSWTVPGRYDVLVTATNCQDVVVTGTLEVLVTAECVSLTGVAIEGPTTLQVGEEGAYLASIAPPTATHPAYLWSDGSTASSTVISWTMAGTYTVAVTATNCQDVQVQDSLLVVVGEEAAWTVYLPLLLKGY